MQVLQLVVMIVVLTLLLFVCRILPCHLHAAVLNRLTHVLDSIYVLRIPVK